MSKNLDINKNWNEVCAKEAGKERFSALPWVTRCSNPDCIVTQNYDGYFEGRNPYPCPECEIIKIIEKEI